MTCCFNCTFVYDIFKSIITLHFSLISTITIFRLLVFRIAQFFVVWLDDGAHIETTWLDDGAHYSCTPNVASIIKSHNKKQTNSEETKQTRNCDCRKKEKCPMETNCRSGNIIYKCVVIATGHPRKVYLGTAEYDFKQWYHNYKKSFRYWKYANEKSLSKYIFEMKDKHNIGPNIMWCIVKSIQIIRISQRDVCCAYLKNMKS